MGCLEASQLRGGGRLLARFPATPRRAAPTTLEAIPARLRCPNGLQATGRGIEDLDRASTVPVGVLGPTDPADVLDDHVFVAGLDRPLAAPAVVELLGNRADDPNFVPIIRMAGQALTPVWKSVEVWNPFPPRYRAFFFPAKGREPARFGEICPRGWLNPSEHIAFKLYRRPA